MSTPTLRPDSYRERPAAPPRCLHCPETATVKMPSALRRHGWEYAWDLEPPAWLCPICSPRHHGVTDPAYDDAGPGKDELTNTEIKSITRDIASTVKRRDLTAFFADVGIIDLLGENPDIPKRKRIAAALTATTAHESDLAWVDRLAAAFGAYDHAQYVERVERHSEHILELDTIRPVGRAIPGYDDDIGRDVSAHIGLTFWGGTGKIARHALLLVREGNRETQIELDLEATTAAITALSIARAELQSSRSYIERRRPRT